MDREKLQRGLGLFLDAMRPYAVKKQERQPLVWNWGNTWPYARIYHNERVTFLNPQEDGYWLLDPSVMPKPAGGEPAPEPGPEPTPTPGPTTTPGPEPTPTPATKTYKKVTISGSVPIENYSQLFPSFVNTLKNKMPKVNAGADWRARLHLCNTTYTRTSYT